MNYIIQFQMYGLTANLSIVCTKPELFMVFVLDESEAAAINTHLYQETLHGKC